MKFLAFFLSLSLLIITHEFGHLGLAKLFKTRVRRFYMFFNWKFSILKAKKFDGKWHFLFFNATTPKEWEEKEPDNTLWGLGWIPLGGYCDIAGMIDETKKAEDLEKEPQPWEYRSKPAWQRLLIISGGVLVNFLSALLIYTCIFAHWGKDELPLRNATLGYEYHQILLDEGVQNGDIIYAVNGEEMYDYAVLQKRLLLEKTPELTIKRGDSLFTMQLSDSFIDRVLQERPDALITNICSPFVVKDFVPGSMASRAGIEIGDSVVSINGEEMVTFSIISAALSEHAGDSITIGLFRNGDFKEVTMKVPSSGKIGVQLKTPLEVFPVEHKSYNIIQAIPAGISHGWETLTTYVSSLKLLFTKNGAQSLGGFISIGSIFPEVWSWQAFWNITALLALILAFMNIIPIPGLDGGHILFTLWEIVTRRKPSDKFLNIAQNVGMALLLALLVLANGNDIWRLIQGLF
ncbi:MAG: RIP metalloprotease RseP [Bacteroidales bacterium]|nr:RIP metalloprotease RseP [Bacteroidales bacterium]